jgi:hypothetical protein
MRALPCALVCAFVSCLCSKPALESKVDVPTTLAGVRALADPPRVTVRVERVNRSGKGGGFRCGHPVCLIVVPLVLWELAFPTKVDVANVTEGGVVTYSGMFKPEGELIQARVQRGKVVRDLRVLELKALRKRLVVEVARGTVGSDGKPGTLEPTPLRGQADLVPEYRAAIAKPRLLTSSDVLLREAIDWLGDEARPLREERLKDAKETDATKEIALRPCDAGLLRLALGLELGPRALEAALDCYSSHAAGGPIREGGPEPFLDRLVARVCSLPELSGFDSKRYLNLLARHAIPARAARLTAAGGKCSNPIRRTLIRLIAGKPATAAEVNALLAAKDGSAEALLQRWSPHDPVVRAAVFAGLRSGQVPLGAVKDTLSSVDLTREELTLLAELYLRPAASHDAVLWHLHRARAQATKFAPAKALLAAALPKATGADRARIALALVVLGDEEQALAALAAIPADGRIGNSRDAQLAADWLERAPLHCRRSELVDAARKLHAGAEVKAPFCEGSIKPATRPSR